MSSQSRIRFAIFLASVVLGAAYWSLRAPTRPAGAGRPSVFRSTNSRTSGWTVSGVVRLPDGSARPATVDLIRPVDQTPSARGIGPSPGRKLDSVSTDASGHFAIAHVPPADYVVVARADDAPSGEGPARHLWATASLTTAALTDPLSLTLHESASIAGRVVATAQAGTPVFELSQVSMMLVPADALARASIAVGYPHAIPTRAGAFTFDDVAPGMYALQYAVEAPWSTDTAFVDGQNWLGGPITLAPGAHVANATVALTDRAGGVAGQVRFGDGRPAGFSLVFVFDAQPSGRLLPRRSAAARASADGRFSVTGLPSGEYLVALAGDAWPQDWYTAPFFESIARSGVRVVVAPGPPREVRLQAR